ncbi:hypothetical protein SAY87_028654 [Trapa incisa]|uniref:Uncharacterized protein n=1 Tax=Trapa incisa TaxID=236973 RepID=A0AAN7L275_9MYRT|nr:hypothetical protein SAY87_028654 [Trapa incisa]
MFLEAEEWPLCIRGLLRDSFSPIANIKIQALKQLPAPTSSKSQDDSSSSSSMNEKECKHSQEDGQSSPLHLHSSSRVSPDSGTGRNSTWNGSLRLTEYNVYKNDGLADASTQTDENVSSVKIQETCTRGISTDDASLDNQSMPYQNNSSNMKKSSEVRSESVSPQPTTSGASSFSRKNETLESLIRAEASMMNSYRIIREEEIRMPANARMKATNMLLQLISCGSISVKDNSFDLIPTYRPRYSPSFPSPMYSTSMLGDLDCISENPRSIGLRPGDKEYFSGSLIETKVLPENGDGLVALKRPYFFNADRTCKDLDSMENGETAFGRSKCTPLSIKSKQPITDSLRSPLPDKPQQSSDRRDGCRTTPPSTSNASSRRISEPLLGDKHSKSLDSFRDEDKVIKIEESLLQELGL